MISTGELFGFFFGIELADGFGGIFESWITGANYDLGNYGGDFFGFAMGGKSVVDGLGEPVTDLALAHSYGGFQRHGGSLVGRGLFFVNQDIADLRTVTVGDDDFIFV